VTWTADGSVLFVDTTRVDADTGQPLESPTGDRDREPEIRAVLADGSQLVSLDIADTSNSSFWLVPPGQSIAATTDEPPLFSGQTLYPAAQVEIAADGRSVAVALTDWDPSGTSGSYLVTTDSVLHLSGTASFSPDRTRALVQTEPEGNGPADWTVVDLATGAATPLPLPDGTGDRVPTPYWVGDGQEVLLVDSDWEGSVISTWLTRPPS
jgi:hypothetical protein